MAGIPISGLPAVPSAQLTDIFPITQGSVNSYKESNSQVLTLFKANGEALSKTNDTNVTLTLGGGFATSLLNASSLTLGWTGTLGVTRGGIGGAAVPLNGQIPIGNGSQYNAANITAGTGIGITNSPSAIIISNVAGGLSWQTITTATQLALANTVYVINNNSTRVVITLPSSVPQGTIVGVQAIGSAGWQLNPPNAGFRIEIGTSFTTRNIQSSNNSTDNVYIEYIIGVIWRVRSTNSTGLIIN